MCAKYIILNSIINFFSVFSIETLFEFLSMKMHTDRILSLINIAIKMNQQAALEALHGIYTVAYKFIFIV